MSKQLPPCKHTAEMYSEDCNTCLYKSLFLTDIVREEPETFNELLDLLDLIDD